MIKKTFFISVLVALIATNVFAQIGGRNVYSFLQLPFSARTAALGGEMVPVVDNDPTLAINNPSLLNESMHNHFNISISDYLSDIKIGNVCYARKFENGYTGLAGLQFINYGEFVRADEFGNILGTFHAAEYAYNFALSKKLSERWSVGSALKFVYSTFERYSSFGLATDYAVTYHDEEKVLTTTFLVSNLGFQIKPYSTGNREPLPLNIQLGFSKKLAHMPLRFILVAHHLNKLDLTYVDPNTNNILTFDNFDQEQEADIPFSEKLFTHFNFAGEFVFSPNFHLRVGYNYQRRTELIVDSKPGMVGFSFGFGMKISKFHIAYANSIYHMAGSTNTFSITTNFSEFVKKDKTSSQFF